MSKINTYRLEQDAYRHPVLVLENQVEYEVESINSPEKAIGVANSVFRLEKMAEEMVIMLSLDSKGQLLGVFQVSHGTVNMSVCSPREVFIRALISGASGFILVHNHPSGISTPSDCDIDVAEKMRKAGELMGIQLLDFIIIGNRDYYSFKDKMLP